MNNDQIDQFKAFIDFVQNADQYKSLITELQTATKSYNDALANLSQGQSLVNWQAKLDQDHIKATQDLVDAQNSFDKQVAIKTQQLVDKETALGLQEANLVASVKDMLDRVAQVGINENLVSNKLNDLTIKQQQLDAKEADLKQRELLLADKTSKLSILLNA